MASALHPKFRDLPTEPLDLDAGTEPVELVARPRPVLFGSGRRSAGAATCTGCGTTRSLVRDGDHKAIRGHLHDWGEECSGSARLLCTLPGRRPECPCERER